MVVSLFTFNSAVALPNYRVCGNEKAHSCLSVPNDLLSFYHENLLLNDTRTAINKTHQNTVVSYCKRLGILKENEGWRDYQRIIIRLLLNPTPDLITTILWNKRELIPDGMIGAHIRCGGLLADTHEGTAMVTLPILHTIPSHIVNITKSLGIHNETVTLYVSTDSSYAFHYLNSSLPSYRIVTTTLYKRGHVEFDNADIVVKRSLIELFLMSQLRTVLLTSASAFSRTIREMGSYRHCFYIRAPYSRANYSRS